VEERPQRVVADLPVEVDLLFGGQEDRVEVIRREPRTDPLLARLRDDGAGPPDPRGVAAERRESGGEAAGAPLDLDLAPVDDQPDRQAVARDDEGVMSRVACQFSSFDWSR
jgi:hypothetical protein